jgi:hypothetical protein
VQLRNARCSTCAQPLSWLDVADMVGAPTYHELCVSVANEWTKAQQTTACPKCKRSVSRKAPGGRALLDPATTPDCSVTCTAKKNCGITWCFACSREAGPGHECFEMRLWRAQMLLQVLQEDFQSACGGSSSTGRAAKRPKTAASSHQVSRIC